MQDIGGYAVEYIGIREPKPKWIDNGLEAEIHTSSMPARLASLDQVKYLPEILHRMLFIEFIHCEPFTRAGADRTSFAAGTETLFRVITDANAKDRVASLNCTVSAGHEDAFRTCVY